MNANTLLARLEELKRWQEKQQERLLQQQMSRVGPQTGTSPEGTPKDSCKVRNGENVDVHTLGGGSPVVVRVDNPDRPRKPFLRRGAGLSRYKMTDEDRKRPYGKSIAMARRNGAVDKVVGVVKSIEIAGFKNDVSPLKVPQVDIKLGEDSGNSRIDEESLIKQTISSINEIAGVKVARSEDVYASFEKAGSYGEFRKLNLQQFFGDIFDNNQMRNDKTNEDQLITKANGALAELNTEGMKQDQLCCSANIEKSQKEISEETLYERNLERELLIFEALEDKVLNSSFSSTNSSILKILASTPNKLKELKLNRNQTRETNDAAQEIIVETTGEFEETPEECCSSAATPMSNSSECSEDKTIENLEEICRDNCCTDDTENFTTDDTSSETTATESTLESEMCPKQFASKSVNTELPECERSENIVTPNTTDKILTEKLKELDQEIQSFRIENAKLQRRALELEKRESQFGKERKEFEKYVLEEKIKLEFCLEEEKKKFVKEKLAFERYVKDVQSKTNRKEREEITALKDEIANVKEAAKLKETRNATSQARLRNQVKSYEREIANLKEELEKLRKANAKLSSSGKYGNRSDTKVLQEINKNLSRLTKDAKKADQIVDRTSPIKPHDDCDVNEKRSRKFDNYAEFLENCPDENRREKVVIESPTTLERKAKELVDDNLVKTYEEVFGRNSLEMTTYDSRNASKDSTTFNDSKMSKTETILPDGTKEVKYSNGNTKTVSPDGNMITVKYFNGDSKETRVSEGVVKYYYAENQSWHITYPDGSEIIEFIDGQVETKRKDGTYEVRLPNGIIKVTNQDKSENLTYPDGTRVNVSNAGDKEIVLPNGQKEVHTKEHMRREYLDGTVKILYPDGIQETRYSNGRIRIKDKEGKLLLDSHEAGGA